MHNNNKHNFLNIIFFFHSADPPAVPRNFRSTELGKDFASLSWDAPESDGGSPITEYVIEKCDVTRGGGANWVVCGTVSASERTYRSAAWEN